MQILRLYFNKNNFESNDEDGGVLKLQHHNYVER